MTDKEKVFAIIRFFISDAARQLTDMARILRKYYVGSKVYLYIDPEGDLLFSLSDWQDELYCVGNIEPYRGLDRLDLFNKLKSTINLDIDDLQKNLQ